MLRGNGYEVHRRAGAFEVFVQLPPGRVEGLQVQSCEQCVEIRYHTRVVESGRVQQCKLVLCVPGAVTGVRQVLCTPDNRLFVQLHSQ